MRKIFAYCITTLLLTSTIFSEETFKEKVAELPPATEPRYAAKDYSYLLGMPGFTDKLLTMHFTLYQGYVKNINELLAKIKTVDPKSYEYGALKRRVGWEFDGMRLHELYFDNLGGTKPINPKSALFLALSTQFGSFAAWKSDFLATGAIRGIGWAILYFDPIEKRLFNTWINEHDVGHLVRGVPILIMDMFEHAYMPEFGLDKAKYMEVFFNNINWDVVQLRYPKG